jgi:hypothetical protein
MFYTKSPEYYPQQKIKDAVKIMEEASILWKLSEEKVLKSENYRPHYDLAQSKAIEAGHMLYNEAIGRGEVLNEQYGNIIYVDPMKSMIEVLELYAPKEDRRLFGRAWLKVFS